MFRITRSVFAVAPFGSIHPYVNYFRNHTGAPWALATIAEPGKYGREWEETPSRSGRANLAKSAWEEIRQPDNEREARCILAFITRQILETVTSEKGLQFEVWSGAGAVVVFLTRCGRLFGSFHPEKHWSAWDKKDRSRLINTRVLKIQPWS